jgi:hypothetical protein
MSQNVDITGLSKAAVLAALFNAAAPQGMGFLQAAHAPAIMDEEHAASIVERQLEVDYLYGRPLKLDLSSDEFDPWGFDRDNGGEGAAWRVIDELRSTSEVSSEATLERARDMTMAHAHEVRSKANTPTTVDNSGEIPVVTLGNADVSDALSKAVDREVIRRSSKP